MLYLGPHEAQLTADIHIFCPLRPAFSRIQSHRFLYQAEKQGVPLTEFPARFQ